MKFNAYQHKYSSIRNVVYAKNGAVATSTPLASQAGLEILKRVEMLLMQQLQQLLH